MKAIYQNRKGLLSPYREVNLEETPGQFVTMRTAEPPNIPDVDTPQGELVGTFSAMIRMTILAREAFAAAGHLKGTEWTFVRPPKNLVVVQAPAEDGFGYAHAVRLKDEPPFPGEREVFSHWVGAQLLHCPECGYALVWYEAGFVPGYRICAGPEHHHVLIKI